MPDLMGVPWWEIRIFLVGLLIAASCSLLSVYVVLRRMAMISEGVSHAGFGGIAVALLVGFLMPALNTSLVQQLITGVFCLATALLIGYVTRRKKVSEDSAIGIFLVASVAFGMLLWSYVRQHQPAGRGSATSIEGLLFGNFTAVTDLDLMLALGVTVALFATVFGLYWQLLYTTLDEDMARVNGVKTSVINTLLLIMISLVIVIGVRMVGFLLITAMMIIPGATAQLLSRKFAGVLTASLLIGILGTLGSLTMAFATDLASYPPGPILVLTLFLFFVLTWAWKQFRKPKPEAEGE